MPTAFTKRYIIAARADLAAQANLAAKQSDTDPVGGERTFTVPLSASGNLPAQAYWCSWQMTPGQAAAIRNRLRERGATVAEVSPIALGSSPASNRFAVFDADDGWTPGLVLGAIGLKAIATAE